MYFPSLLLVSVIFIYDLFAPVKNKFVVKSVHIFPSWFFILVYGLEYSFTLLLVVFCFLR